MTQQSAPAPIAPRPARVGMNIMLLGGFGSGKTTSLRTLLDITDPETQQPALDVFVIFTEPRYDVLDDSVLEHPRFHWQYIPVATASWNTLTSIAKQINTLTNEALQKSPGIERQHHDQFLRLLVACNDFVDQRGQHYGDVSLWGTNRVLVLDSWTGISKMSKNLAIGAKPILTQPDWGVAMDNLARFMDKITMDKRCHLIVTGHLEREIDEVSGGLRKTISTLGRKLAPTLGTNFSDIILAIRNATEFMWDTADPTADLKASNLSISSKNPATFGPLFEAWYKRGGRYA